MQMLFTITRIYNSKKWSTRETTLTCSKSVNSLHLKKIFWRRANRILNTTQLILPKINFQDLYQRINFKRTWLWPLLLIKSNLISLCLPNRSNHRQNQFLNLKPMNSRQLKNNLKFRNSLQSNFGIAKHVEMKTQLQRPHALSVMILNPIPKEGPKCPNLGIAKRALNPTALRIAIALSVLKNLPTSTNWLKQKKMKKKLKISKNLWFGITNSSLLNKQQKLFNSCKEWEIQ